MRIGLDAHMVGGRETGNETYVKGLVGGFEEQPRDVDVVVYNVGRPWASAQAHVRFHPLLTANPYFRLGLELPLRSLQDRLDILHVTYTAPAWSPVPLVLTIHDICFTTNPEWFSARDLRVLNTNIPRSIRKAAHVITDSQSARSQIIEHYRVPEERISAITIGPGPGAQAISAEEAKQELEALDLCTGRPYLLAVGNLQPRKNLVRMIDAFRQVVAGGHDIDLVIVGPRHYRADDALEAAATVADRVHFTGYVSDRQLAACYRCCTVFVFPSLYEGFGLPAIEAMSHGVPIACSNAGALPEVCADAALLFDPLSVDAMAAAVDRLLGDSALRTQLGAAGRARADDFSWKATAEQTIGVYEKVRA